MRILSLKGLFLILSAIVMVQLTVSEITNAESSSKNSACKQGVSDLASDVTVYIVKALDTSPILPDTSPRDLKTDGCELLVTAARGEYEPASFVVRPGIELIGDLNFALSPLINSTAVIPESNIDIKVVKVWYQAEEAWIEIARARSAKSDREILVPELLMNDELLVRVDASAKGNYLRINDKSGEKYIWKGSKEKHQHSIINLDPGYTFNDAPSLLPIRLEKNKNKQFWLTFFVPFGTKAGEYTGSVTISSSGRKLVNLPVKLNVLPFELDESRLEFGIYYHGRIHDSRKESISSEYKSPMQLRAELLDMLKHGFKNPVIYQHHSENKDLLREYLSIRKDIGMDNSKLYFMWLNTKDAISEGQIRNLKKNIIDLNALLKEFGTKEIYVYGIDEAKGHELTKQKKAWDAVREIGAKVYVAGYEGTYETMGKSLDLFVFAKSPMKQEAEKYHSINHKIFSYANPQSGVESPYLYRRNYGLVLWASGFDGAMVYAYQHSMGDAWNDSDHPIYRDHNFTYPTSDGVIGTIEWEGMREAIDDVRYLTSLENTIAKIRAKGNLSNSALVKDAEIYMASLKNEANKHNRYGRYTNDFNIDLYKVRETLINYIIQLNKQG